MYDTLRLFHFILIHFSVFFFTVFFFPFSYPSSQDFHASLHMVSEAEALLTAFPDAIGRRSSLSRSWLLDWLSDRKGWHFKKWIYTLWQNTSPMDIFHVDHFFKQLYFFISGMDIFLEYSMHSKTVLTSWTTLCNFK